MASVDNIIEFALPPSLGIQMVRVQLTGASSTFVTRFTKTDGFIATVEGTNTTTYARSSNTITITGTNDDYVNFIIWGQ